MKRLVIAAFALAGAVAPGGVVMDSTVESSSGKVETPRLWAEGSSFRLESREKGAASAAAVLLFRGDRLAMYVISPAQKSYTIITPQTLDETSKTMEMLARNRLRTDTKLQAMLAALPPGKRAEVERSLLPKRAPPAKLRFNLVGTGKVGQWPCQKYKQTGVGGSRVEVCTAKWADVGIAAADLVAFKKFREMLKPEHFAVLGGDRMAAWSEEQMALGFAVETLLFDEGSPKPSSHTIVNTIKKEKLDQALFDVPAGYEERRLQRPASPAKGPNPPAPPPAGRTKP